MGIRGDGEVNMRKFKIAICDDEIYYIDRLYSYLEECKNIINIDMKIDTYNSGEDLLKSIDNIHYHMIFLDIEMKGMTGICAARKINEINDKTQIVFATSHKEFAIDAFDIYALGYLLKPISFEKLKEILLTGLERINLANLKNQLEEAYIVITEDYVDKKISQNNIIYIEKKRNKCMIKTDDSTYYCYDSLKKIYGQLNKDVFIYTHQGFIVNINNIKEISASEIIIKNGKNLPMSRKHKGEVKERFFKSLNSM